MAYEKDKDYQALINDAVGSGDYKSAAQYEQQRNEKIAGEGITNYEQTNKYSGWLDDTDYSTILNQQMSSGASADDVADTLGKRVNKAAGTEGLSQYAYDDVYSAAMDYILNNNKASQEFKYEEAPAWSSKYSEQIDELTQALLGRDSFSYNKETDPLYAQYKDTYTREGNRAMQDTIGQVSARTGGLASSYAATAGAQANDYYMSQLADKVPELQQLAYSMYQDEGDRQMQNIQLLMALEEGDYEKYADLLSQYNADRSFDYGVYSDDKSFDYQTGQDAKTDARSRIASYLKLGGNLADLDEQLIADSGYSPAELELMMADNAKAPGGPGGDDEDYDITNQHGDSWIVIPGHGRYSFQEIYNYVESGQVIETVDKDKGSVSYKWNDRK